MKIKKFKIKKFDNLWTMGMIICGVALLSIYFAKLFFPGFVIEISHTENIIKIGHYIDNHKWAWYVASSIVSYVSYYLSFCACCGKKKLTWKENLVILVTIVFGYGVKEFLPQYFTAINYVLMILIPYVLGAKFKNTTIVFSSLIILQVLTVDIRNIINRVADFNYATLLVLMLDYYIVQVLLYLLFNHKERNKNYGNFKCAYLR